MRKAEGAGPNCEMIGTSGERGCYQYMPGRFSQVSKQATGEVLAWNRLNEEYVTLRYIQSRLRAGLTPQQFALEWNQGNYKMACSSGSYLKAGKMISYDSCQHNKIFTVAYNQN